MPGHAVAAGSAFGGFIEGLTGGFQDVTEFRGRRADRRRLAEGDRADRERLARLDEAAARRDQIAMAEFLAEHPELAALNELGPGPITEGAPRVGSTRIRRDDSDEMSYVEAWICLAMHD